MTCWISSNARALNWLAFGIEAASERVRDDVDKGFGQEEIFRTLEKVRAAALTSLPTTSSGCLRTIWRACRQLLTWRWSSIASSPTFIQQWRIPALSFIISQSKRAGRCRKNGPAILSTPLILYLYRPNTCQGEKCWRVRDHAFHTYFSNQRYLDMVTQKFGLETAKHIRQMASHNLERKHIPSQASEPNGVVGQH